MGHANKIVDRVRIRVREICNPIVAPLRRRFLHNQNFTIISNNCWAGHVYRYYNICYNTPTVGLFFFSDDYIKFVYNLRHYLESELRFISIKESKYQNELINRGHINCPIGRLDDIEVVFLHYKSSEEAFIKWNRRKQRVIWDNIYFKFSEQNLCSFENLLAFDSLMTDKKLVFVSEDYGLKSQIVFKEYIGEHSVPNDTLNFRKYVNLTRFLNQKPFKLHQ